MALRAAVRQFCDSAVHPVLATVDASGGASTRKLALELGKLGLLGMQLDGYGCSGASAVDYGLACLELQACDARCRDLVTTQGSLVMLAISLYGSEEHKTRWIPRLATGGVVGCSVRAPSTPPCPTPTVTAVPHGDEWVLDGMVAGVPYAATADLAVVWARSGSGLCAFLLPLPWPGVGAASTHGPGAAGATLRFSEVRVPDLALLPGAAGPGADAACADDERYGVLWGAMGAARAAFRAALESTSDGRHPAALVDMSLDLVTGTLLALHLGRRKDSVGLQREQVVAGKLANVEKAMRVCRGANSLLGGRNRTVQRHLASLQREHSDASQIRTWVAETLTGRRVSETDRLKKAEAGVKSKCGDGAPR